MVEPPRADRKAELCIEPPEVELEELCPRQLCCPYCGSKATAPVGLFGPTLSEVPMWCSTCASGFTWFKW